MSNSITNSDMDQGLVAVALSEKPEDLVECDTEGTAVFDKASEKLNADADELWSEEFYESPLDIPSPTISSNAEGPVTAKLKLKPDKTSHSSEDDEVPSTVAGDDSDLDPSPWWDPYIPFPIGVLPEVVRNFVSAASEAIGCDSAFVALPLLASLARVIGNRRTIRLKDSWDEPAIIWGALVGQSGTHKSPALRAGMSFLRELEEKSHKSFQAAMLKYTEKKMKYERKLAAWRKEGKNSTSAPPRAPEQPKCRRFMTTDATIEALASLLANQFDGVLLERDELAGWFGGIAEYKGGKGSDLGHWLSFWSAAQLTVDRKTGEQRSLHLPRAAVSIVGGIQPEVLIRAIGREHLQDGLCARLLLAMPESKPVRWSEAAVSLKTKAAMARVFKALLGLEVDITKSGSRSPHAIPLSTGALAAWIKFYNRHRDEMRTLDDDLAAAWSKLEAYTARFALIFQLCDWASGERFATAAEIDEDAMLRAIELSDWFGNEARRVYRLFSESKDDRQERELFQLISRLGDSASARDIMRHSKRFGNTEAVEVVMQRLADRGCGKWDVKAPAPTGGRPSRRFVLSCHGG
jgi:hypothetical protein